MAFRQLYGFSVGRIPGWTQETFRKIKRIHSKGGGHYNSIASREYLLTKNEELTLKASFRAADLPQGDEAAGETLLQLRNIVMTQLCQEEGSRPVQIAGLNEDDLIVTPSVAGGDSYYSLRIPRAKQGAATRLTTETAISLELGRKIERLIALNHQCSGLERKGLPLFRKMRKATGKSVLAEGGITRLSTTSVGLRIVAYCDALGMTGVCALKLRHTVGQALADMGYPAEVIARKLDQESDEAPKAYIRATLKLSDVLCEALAGHEPYGDFLALLSGEYVVPEEITPETNVVTGTVGPTYIGPIGKCGLPGTPCSLSPVYSCYSCRKFAPIVDPERHREVLAAIVNETRAELEQADRRGIPVKAATAHRDTILGIQAVIEQIVARQQGGDHE